MTRFGWRNEKFVPVDDQCGECRCAPGTDHNEDCWSVPDDLPLQQRNDLCPVDCPTLQGEDMDPPINIPWSVQQELFDLHARQALDALPGYLHLHGDTIIAMAAARMESGYHEYGSKAFGWSTEERLLNMLEELADSVVYLVTGPVE